MECTINDLLYAFKLMSYLRMNIWILYVCVCTVHCTASLVVHHDSMHCIAKSNKSHKHNVTKGRASAKRILETMTQKSTADDGDKEISRASTSKLLQWIIIGCEWKNNVGILHPDIFLCRWIEWMAFVCYLRIVQRQSVYYCILFIAFACHSDTIVYHMLLSTCILSFNLDFVYF